MKPGTRHTAESRRKMSESQRARDAWLNSWRGRLAIPAHCHPLVRQFFTLLNRQKVTIQEVAGRVGCHQNTPSSWRYLKNPQLSIFIACLNAIGYDLKIVPIGKNKAREIDNNSYPILENTMSNTHISGAEIPQIPHIDGD